MKKRIVNRLRMLWSFELINVLLLPAMIWMATISNGISLSFRDWLAFVPMGFILIQGSAYWRFKLAAVEGQPDYLERSLGWFRFLRGLNWPMIALMGAWVFWPNGPGGIGWGIGVAAWILTLLEQINYFYVQLMHDTVNDWQRLMRDRRLRKSQLAVDLDRLNLG